MNKNSTSAAITDKYLCLGHTGAAEPEFEFNFVPDFN